MTDQEFRADILPLQDAMYRVAFILLRNEEDAADIVQDTILKLWQKHKELSRSQNHKAYCLTAARNNALSLLRSRDICEEIPESLMAPDNLHKNMESKRISRDCTTCSGIAARQPAGGDPSQLLHGMLQRRYSHHDRADIRKRTGSSIKRQTQDQGNND